MLDRDTTWGRIKVRFPPGFACWSSVIASKVMSKRGAKLKRIRGADPKYLLW